VSDHGVLPPGKKRLDTALYQRSQRRLCILRLQKLQTDIVKSVTERRVELEVLHRRVRGQHMARRFLGMINARWKPLDNLVAAYNAEVQRYNEHVDPDGAVRLRPSSYRDLREVDIDDDLGGFDEEVVDRLMQGSDCCGLRKREQNLEMAVPARGRALSSFALAPDPEHEEVGSSSASASWKSCSVFLESCKEAEGRHFLDSRETPRA
jgi:hypothetical protein